MNTQIINISLPKELLEEIDKRAQQESRSRSELLREAARVYLRRISSWDEIYKLGRKTAKKFGIKTEEDVYRVIQDFRHGK